MSLIFERIAAVSVPDEEPLPVKHLVTLQEPATGEEITMMIFTANDSFCEVMREIKRTVLALFLEEGIDYRRYRYYDAYQIGQPAW